MSPEERRNFIHRWGHRNSNPMPEPPSAHKLKRLKDDMLEKRSGIPSPVVRYVEAALAYGVEQTRSEYRPLANRNFKTIQKFGVRALRLLLAVAVILLFLGWRSFETTHDIQSSRRNAVVEKCHAGQKALKKLEAEIGHLTEPRKAEELAAIGPTRELIETITGPIDENDRSCAVAIKRAGL